MKSGQRRALALPFLFGLLCAPGAAWGQDAVVGEVIRLSKEKALNRDAPDWPMVEREAHALTLSLPGEDGRTAAIRLILASLEDRHSSYRPPPSSASASQSRGPQNGSGVLRAPIAESDVETGRPGVLVISSWSGGSSSVPEATRLVRTELNRALSASGCGIVIDISQNSGGNMWPMMGGIAALYDDGVLETFESADGHRQAVSVRRGALYMDHDPYPRVELAPLVNRPRHVALVIGPRTASSAEILALGFKGQSNVRVFGKPSAGATTANQSIRLSNGGLLALTTARILDRSGLEYVGPVEPDTITEKPLDEATGWIAESCK